MLPQFLLGTPRYYLPAVDAVGSQQQLWQLTRTLLADDLVMIASFAFSAAAHRRVVCLMPRVSKSGMPVGGGLWIVGGQVGKRRCSYAHWSYDHLLIDHLLQMLVQYSLPHSEDLRNFEFPSLVDNNEPISEMQQDVMDEFVDALMLADTDGNNEIRRPKV